MRRTLVVLVMVTSVQAQATRESYRVPFQTWRQATAGLEQDAAAPGADFGPRVETAGQMATNFLNARVAFYEALPTASRDQFDWMSRPFAHPEGLLSARPEIPRLLDSTAQNLTNSINSFAPVKDPAIQQVRQAMERERAALKALNDAITARVGAVKELITSADSAEILRSGVSQAHASSAASNLQLIDHVKREASAWAMYYKDLAEAVAVPTQSAPASTAAITPPPKPVVATVKPAAPRPTATQFPLARYTGSWTFPTSSGLFFGPEPETVALTVDEGSGALQGVVSVRFKGNPTPVRAQFAGPVAQTRNQSLPITTAGTTGTVELIPGPAFNLLEVNLQWSGGTVRQANFVLIKE